MKFEILGNIEAIEIIAIGTGIRDLAYLQKVYGRGRWRKLKGIAFIKLPMAIFDMLNFTGTKRKILVAKTSRSNIIWMKPMKTKKHFVLCIDNKGYEASLITRKVYEVMPDEQAEKDDLIRIIDESGEDYLYHTSHFVFIHLSAQVERVLVAS